MAHVIVLSWERNKCWNVLVQVIHTGLGLT